MKTIFGCLSLVLALTTVPVLAQQAAPSVEKKELILKFIDIFGTKRTMEQNLEAMFEDMGPNDPQTKKFKENVKVQEIIDQLIPLYDKYFSEEDLNAFITFYSSAAGQKLLTTIPLLMRDSVEISAKYFEEKFPEAEKTPAQDKTSTSENVSAPAEDTSSSSITNTTP